MAAGKKTPEKHTPGTSTREQSMRDSAEEQLARIPKRSAALKEQTPEQLVHELQVHQIELETQAEELRRAHLALAESRDKYLDLYEFAPLGYLTLTDKALIAEVNLSGSTLLGVERSSLVNTRFRQFIALEDLHVWDPYFVNVLSREEKQNCTLTLQRKDGSAFPARLEGSRIKSSSGAITARIAFSDITDIWQIEALRESEERFRKIFENSPLGMVLVTPEFRFFSVNPAWISMTGYAEKELLKMTFPDLTHPDHRAGDLEHIQELMKGTIPVYNSEKRYIRKDGSILWGLIRVTVIRDHQGSLRYFAAQIEDITDRKLAEKTLFRILREQQIILDNANIGISLIADRKQIWVNRKTEDLFQYPKEELEGHTTRKLYPSQEAYEQLGRDAYPVLSQGQTYECEQQLIRRDGTQIWVRYNGKAVDPSDPAKGTLWLLEDITGRKLAEAGIHESARYTRSLIEASLDPLVMISPAGRITDVNAATEQVTGYTRDHLIGTDFTDYFTDTGRAKDGYQKVFAEGSIRDYPLEIKNRDGTIRQVLYNAAVYRDGSGTVKGVFAAARDITDRKLVENALALASRKLTLLSGITRHDINNQLLILNGFLGIIKKEMPDPAFEKDFSHVTEASRRISRMIQFTKEYERIGVDAPVWQDCRALADTATQQAPLGAVRVKNDLPSGAEVFADLLIVKVFYNLMENAVRYGGKITTIRFSAEEQEGNHIIVCEDDGEGVAAGEKEQIFARGFGKNTGMGLALSREILSITGITLQETGEPGRGARFELIVPKGAWRMTGKGA
jgi:PAS domain S-box-containing protein